MRVKNKIITLRANKEFDFINLTEVVKKFVKASKILNGFINIQSLHTTAALLINEDEPLLLKDIKKHLTKFAPKNKKYQHDIFHKKDARSNKNKSPNGHAHCKAILLPTNVTLNIVNGKLQLGRWQQIFFIEFDKPRERFISLQIIGR